MDRKKKKKKKSFIAKFHGEYLLFFVERLILGIQFLSV